MAKKPKVPRLFSCPICACVVSDELTEEHFGYHQCLNLAILGRPIEPRTRTPAHAGAVATAMQPEDRQ